MDFVNKVCGFLYYIFHFSAFENNIKTFQNTEFVIPILKIDSNSNTKMYSIK